jgi:membrane protein involved in colicin uptake
LSAFVVSASCSLRGRAALKVLIAALFSLTVSALSGFAQERKALTLDGIISLLRAGTSPARVSQLIETHGVAFELDEAALRRLRENQASETVLSAVKKMAAQYAEEQQRQRRAAKAEQERQEKEAKARVEQERREREAAAKAERERQQKEAAAKAEQERQEKEAEARVERERRERDAAAKAERERQQKEAAAKAEQERQEKETKARVERERRERETAAKTDSQIASRKPETLPRVELTHRAGKAGERNGGQDRFPNSFA